MLKKSMGGKHVIVWLDNSSGHLRGWGNGERKLGFSSIVDRKTLKEKGTKTRSATTTSSVVDQETLKTSTVVSKLSDTVKDKINNFLADGVVTTGIVVGSIFLTRDELFRVIELTVGTGSDLI